MQPLTETQQQLLDWLEEYVFQHGYSPSTKEMREAIAWKSAASVRYHLKKLHEKGWLDWVGNTSRNYLFRAPKIGLIPILGSISAHSLSEVFPETDEKRLNLRDFPQFRRMSSRELSRCFALRVIGDSMICALIDNGDVVILKPPTEAIKNGTIVAARVEGTTTLKYYYNSGKQVTLKPANPAYEPTVVDAALVDVQGVYVGLVRGLF
jgi:repressor LexA